MEEPRFVKPNFITDIIDADLSAGRVDEIVTRFPPEPNGYLHIGHAKAICLDFGVALDYGGHTFLRFDDTNPTAEDPEFVRAIEEDVRWLGYQWREVRHASDYFDQLYRWAEELITRGLAYVDSLSEAEVREYRGSVTEPGKNSPYRERSVAENLDLFRRMAAGEFRPGTHVLRAKIDMSASNMKMRDPALYRIVDTPHHRTGDSWSVYPMYDFAHPLSDAIEGITHSLCTLEFENNREVYDWLVDHLVTGRKPHQYEFARLQFDYTITSKRRLARLVAEGHVTGWDDPRMPTIAAIRRRGVTPAAIRDMTNRVGVARANSRTDLALFDHSIRDDLNDKAPRVMAVLEPLVLELTNLEEAEVQWLHAPYWPHDVPREGSRQVPLTRELVIERADYQEEPERGFKRLAPGRAVRLRHGPVIVVEGSQRDVHGAVTKVLARVVAGSVGAAPADLKVSAAVHWVSRRLGVPLEARLYQPLFSVPDPEAGGGDFTSYLNPDALTVVHGLIEPSVLADSDDTRYQFERLGYFWRDPVDSRDEQLVFNRITALKDGFSGARRQPRAEAPAKPEPATVAKRAQGSSPAPGPAPEVTALAERLAVGVSDAEALANRPELLRFFEATVAAGAPSAAAATWVVNDVARELKDGDGTSRLTPPAVAELIELVSGGTVTVRVAKELLSEIAATGEAPRALVAARGLETVTDPAAVAEAVRRVLDGNPAELAAYRGGKTALRGFFVGQVMRALGGRADPAAVQGELDAALDAS